MNAQADAQPAVAGALASAQPLESRIAALISARQAGARDVQVTGLKALTGGNARRAWAFDVVWADAAGTHQLGCVLLGRIGAGQLEVDGRREFETLWALKDTGLAVPRALWFDEDGAHLGMPGFVMERGAGRANLGELLKPDSTITGPLAGQLVSIAGQLHALDWQAVMPSLAQGDSLHASSSAPLAVLQQWEAQFHKNRLEPLPALCSVFGWLHRRMPAPGRLAIVHGDLRLGNFLHDQGRITLLLDWEMAHLGDAMEDIAWAWRSMWSPEAFLPLQEALPLYEKAAGHAVDPRRLAWYRIFSEAKFAVISLTAARSFMDGATDNLRLAGRASKVSDCLRLALQWMNEEDAVC